jgi:hypothetical protein
VHEAGVVLEVVNRYISVIVVDHGNYPIFEYLSILRCSNGIKELMLYSMLCAYSLGWVQIKKLPEQV